METTRVCRVCNEEKSINDFSKSGKKLKSGGISENRLRLCKPCKAAQKRRRYVERMGEDENFVWMQKVRQHNRVSSFKSKIVNDAIVNNKIDPIELKELFYLTNAQCQYCGCDVTPLNFHVEHKIPLSRGGLNKIENIAISCAGCNQLKHDRTEEEFMVFIHKYIKQWQERLGI